VSAVTVVKDNFSDNYARARVLLQKLLLRHFGRFAGNALAGKKCWPV